MSKAQTKQVISGLKKLYKDAGGEKDFEQEEMIAFQKSVGTFDARVVLLVNKIDFTREKINERDEMLKKKNKGGTAQIQLSNNIKKMIQFIKKDISELQDMHNKSSRKALFKKALDPQKLLQQEKDIELLHAHVREVESLDKRRFGGGEKNEGMGKADLFAGADDTKEALLDKGSGSAFIPFSDVALPEDPRYSNLPKVDISKSMSQVQQNKKLIEQGLDTFSNKLEMLMDQAQGIGTELEDQNKLIDKIERKVDKENTKLEDLNKRVEVATVEVTRTGRLTIILILLVVLIIILVVVGVYLIMLFKPSLPIF